VSDKPALTPVADALAGILAGALARGPAEMVALPKAAGRTLAEGLVARRTQPPFPASSMDGFAIRASDVASTPTRLRIIGVSAAGHGFRGEVRPGEAVRIFTGAPIPAGADTILIQENARQEGDAVVALQPEPPGRFIRAAGYDFRAGSRLLAAGTRLGPRHLSLAAAMDHAEVPVWPRPRVAILATGDELVFPGQKAGPDQILASNSFAVAALAENAGAHVFDLGVALDSMDALEEKIAHAVSLNVDVLVTMGGASVGDHDLVQRALQQRGMELGFWKIAMRPGKPLMFGHLAGSKALGLPGNPVASVVCAMIFLVPLVRALSGDHDPGRDMSEPALLGVSLKANDERQDYLRATLERRHDGMLVATPFAEQDSGQVSLLAAADALVIREPLAAAAMAGSPCRIRRL
jgi:molybdopterin molybdotransferase